MQDRDLLHEYVESRSQDAFAELVHRHMRLVYGTALRISGQPAMAEDISQNVFVRLAQKAKSLRERDALPGWLYRTTCHAAYSVIRAERRRRERETVVMQLENVDAHSAWQRLAPLLDEGMSDLDKAEQDAVVLRFFEGLSLREVGEALGLNDDAAQKRVSRALEKLRKYFIKNGVVMPALLLTPTLLTHAAPPAPPHLAGYVLKATKSISAGSNTISLLHPIYLMSQSKLRISLLGIIAIFLLSLLAWLNWPIGEKSPGNIPTLSTPTSLKGQKKDPQPSLAAVESPRLAATTLLASSKPAPSTLSGPPFSLDQTTRAQYPSADQFTMTQHASFGLNLATAFISYANGHKNQLPTDIATALAAMSTKNEGYPYEIVYAGSLNFLPNPAGVILLKEQPFQLSNGDWARTYVFADQHVNTAISHDGDFAAWEATLTTEKQPAQAKASTGN